MSHEWLVFRPFSGGFLLSVALRHDRTTIKWPRSTSFVRFFGGRLVPHRSHFAATVATELGPPPFAFGGLCRHRVRVLPFALHSRYRRCSCGCATRSAAPRSAGSCAKRAAA